jgi:pilus assembly protein CpaE
MIVTFFGTKGGTGTTTLAVNCAADIRRLTGRRTLVVDLKTGPGDVAVFLGLRPRYNLLDLLDQLSWMDPSAIPRFVAEHECGLHALTGADEFGRPGPRDAEAIDQALRSLPGSYDYIVIDGGSMLTATSAAALQRADLVMLVANPDVPCLRNLPRLTDAVRMAGVASERIRIVLNRAADSGALPVAQIEAVLGRRIDYSVTSDYRTVASALNAGVPVSALRPCDVQTQLGALAKGVLGSDLRVAS